MVGTRLCQHNIELTHWQEFDTEVYFIKPAGSGGTITSWISTPFNSVECVGNGLLATWHHDFMPGLHDLCHINHQVLTPLNRRN